jgi:hypothetical protein
VRPQAAYDRRFARRIRVGEGGQQEPLAEPHLDALVRRAKLRLEKVDDRRALVAAGAAQ